MKIDRKTLNLVIPILDTRSVKDEDGKEHEEDVAVAYVHSSPIGRETFETFFLPMSTAFSQMYARGLGALAGPRVAGLLLKKAAQDLGMAEDVESGLIAEIIRRTNVLMAKDQGWDMVPYDQVRQQKLLPEDDLSEVDNAITFFTLASAIHRKQDVPTVVDGAARLWGAEITSFNCTEFKNSLTTLTQVASSGAKAPRSPIPH